MPNIESDEEYTERQLELERGEVPPQFQRMVKSALMRYESVNPQVRMQREQDVERLGSIGETGANLEAARNPVDEANPPAPFAAPVPVAHAAPAAASPLAKFDTGRYSNYKPPTVSELPGAVGDGIPEVMVDPSFQEFLRQRGDAIAAQHAGDPTVIKGILHRGKDSPEFKQWANELWQAEMEKAQTEGRSVQRLGHGRGLMGRLGDLYGGATDKMLALSSGALNNGLLVAPNAADYLLRKTGNEGLADTYRQAEERNSGSSMAGAALGTFGARQGLGNLVARGTYGGLTKLGTKLLPKVAKADGLAASAGRTAAAGLAGGTGAALEEGVRQGFAQDLSGQEMPQEQSEEEMVRAFLAGAAPGAALHAVGGGARRVAARIEDAHPEIRMAERAGVRPALNASGAVAAEDSPVHALEAERKAGQMETLGQAATLRTAPRLADAAAEQNAAAKLAAEAETAEAYEGLNRAGVQASTAPVVGRLRKMIDEERVNPETGGQVPFLQSDAPLRKDLQNALVVEERAPRLVPGRKLVESPPLEAPRPPEQVGWQREAQAKQREAFTPSQLRQRMETRSGLPRTPSQLREASEMVEPPVRLSRRQILAMRDTLPPGIGEAGASRFEQEAGTVGEQQARLRNLQRATGTEPGAMERVVYRKRPPQLEEGEQLIPHEDAYRMGLTKVPPSEGPVFVVLRPTKLSAQQYDLMVSGLEEEAKFGGKGKKGDQRYRALEAAALEGREQFGPEFSAMKKRQAAEMTAERQRVEGAGLRMGEDNKVRPWNEMAANDQKAFLGAVGRYKAAGRDASGIATDRAAREIADRGGLRRELELVPEASSVDDLLEAVSGKGGVHGVAGPGGIRGYLGGKALGSLAMRIQPTLKAIGSVARPERELVRASQALSPALRKALVAMRRDVKSDLGMGRLSSRIGLRGGVAGQRAASVVERALDIGAVTEEDLENLLKLKRAVSGSTEDVQDQGAGAATR